MTPQPRLSPQRSSLAQWARALLLIGLITMLVCVGWIWSRSAFSAIVVLCFWMTAHAWVLAIEFFLIPVLRGDDDTPRASPFELARAWAAEVVQGWRVFAWRQPFFWHRIPDLTHGPDAVQRTGVVLVHGIICNRGFWTPWLKRLRANGRAFVALNLEPILTGIDDYVTRLDAAVGELERSTGHPPLIVCHSMGGLVARAWLRGTDVSRVRRVVTIGTPHHGTWYARFSRLPNGRQMHPDGEWIRQLNADWTPAQANRFVCWYSNCDNIVQPPLAATLPDADNRLVIGAAHVELAFREEVMHTTLAMLE